MRIVDVNEIPNSITETPLSDLFEIYKTCQKMELLCESLGGIGLAAAQVGIPWKLFVMKSDCAGFVPAKQYGYFVNCDYEPLTEEQVVSLEGCLSVRSPEGQLRLFQVNRYTTIRLHGWLLTDEMKTLNPIDEELGIQNQCIVFQHEIDHQNGRLISDIGKEVFLW